MPGLYVDGNHLYDIDLSSGTIKTSRGIEVAQIEEDRIYRTYPKGAHELIAKVETRFAEPTPMYAKDPTDLTRVRMLETNDLVQIVEARDGWYQLRYVDESGNAILYWAFAPMLLTNVNRDGQSNFQPITFTTRPSKRAVLRSTLESAERVQRDIHTILSGLPNGG